MAGWILLLLLLAALLWFAWPRPVFEIVVVEGKAKVKRGEPERAFIDDCESICADNGIPYARIRGTRRQDGALGIEVVGQHAKPLRQRFLNAWAFHQ